jgi:hypothetical protein
MIYHNAECNALLIIMLNVIMLSVVILDVVMLRVVAPIRNGREKRKLVRLYWANTIKLVCHYVYSNEVAGLKPLIFKCSTAVLPVADFIKLFLM